MTSLSDSPVCESEHIVIRDQKLMPTLKTPRPGLLEDVPPGEGMKHWDIVGIGLSYYDALTVEDGTLSPLAKECERHENGMIATGGAPTPQDQQIPGAKLDPAMACGEIWIFDKRLPNCKGKGYETLCHYDSFYLGSIDRGRYDCGALGRDMEVKPSQV